MQLLLDTNKTISLKQYSLLPLVFSTLLLLFSTFLQVVHKCIEVYLDVVLKEKLKLRYFYKVIPPGCSQELGNIKVIAYQCIICSFNCPYYIASKEKQFASLKWKWHKERFTLTVLSNDSNSLFWFLSKLGKYKQNQYFESTYMTKTAVQEWVKGFKIHINKHSSVTCIKVLWSILWFVMRI